MTTYTTYQCSECRRLKDVIRDTTRSMPNQCIITKGCNGYLFKVGDAQFFTPTPPVAGLDDWTPKGTIINTSKVETLNDVKLSTSAIGTLTLAIYQTDAEAVARNVINLKLLQRRAEDVNYQQFLFKPTTATALISGRDLSGKNLKFDQSSIDEKRVFIRVNGVARFQGTGPNDLALSPNIVTFNNPVDANSTIDISVYSEKDTITKTLTFTSNRTTSPTTDSGAWSNIRFLREYDSSGNVKPLKWWLYTCLSIGSITSTSRLKIESIADDIGTDIISGNNLSNVRFLLSNPRYENLDRYLNFYADAKMLSEDFTILSAKDSFTELAVDRQLITELYPPFILSPSGNFRTGQYIQGDAVSTDTSINVDTGISNLTNNKVIGPI